MNKLNRSLLVSVWPKGYIAGAVLLLCAFALGAVFAQAQGVPELLVSDYNGVADISGGPVGPYINLTGVPGVSTSTGHGPDARGMAIGPDGNLYVASFSLNSILRFSAVSGAFIDEFVPTGSGGLSGPTGLTFGPDNNLYVVSYRHGVLQFNGTTGAFMSVFAQAPYPTDLTFGPDNNLYVTSGISGNGAVLRFNGSTGALMGTFAHPGLIAPGNPSGLRFGPDGNLYVASPAPAILRFNGTTGAPVGTGTFASPGSLGPIEPAGIAFGPDDNLYVVNVDGSVLEINGRTGASIGTLGTGIVTPQFLLFTTSTPPPSTSGAPPPSSIGSGTLAAKVTALSSQVAALSAQVSTLQAAESALLPSVATLQTAVAALQADDAATQTNVAALQSQVAKLSGQITADDLAGTYALVQFQNELGEAYTGRPAYVASYVITGTLTLNADGTGSGTQTQTGNDLSFSGTLSADNISPESGTFSWTYSSGVVTITLTKGPNSSHQVSFTVAAGGRVMTAASAKNVSCPDNACGSNELIILTRLD